MYEEFLLGEARTLSFQQPAPVSMAPSTPQYRPGRDKNLGAMIKPLQSSEGDTAIYIPYSCIHYVFIHKHFSTQSAIKCNMQFCYEESDVNGVQHHQYIKTIASLGNPCVISSEV